MLLSTNVCIRKVMITNKKNYLKENRKMIIDAMRQMAKGGQTEVKPNDVIKYFGVTANSKDGKNISRTMLRMSNNAEILSTAKYGYYKLPTEEDLNHNHY